MNQTAVPHLSRRYLELAAVLALLLVVFGVPSLAHGAYRVQHFGPDGFQNVDVPDFWFYLSVPLTALAPLLALRRPLVATLSALVAPLCSLIFDVSLFSAFVGVVATGVVLLGRSTRQGVALAAAGLLLPLDLVLGGTMIVPDGSAVYPTPWSTAESSTTFGLYAVAVLVSLVAGLGYRSWAGNAEVQARLAAERSEVDKQGALLGERARLARDLHDVVAHHVSLIAVRAETARYTVPDLQPAARVVLTDIAEESRKALDELRGVLGILGRSDDGPARAPQPGGEDIASLVDRARGSGRLELTGEEHLAALPSTQGYVAYRVVQEALTNARRHAPGEPVEVVADRTDGLLSLRISNRSDTAEVVPGRGLTGMRERIEALGGTMSADIRGGAVVVEVHLP